MGRLENDFRLIPCPLDLLRTLGLKLSAFMFIPLEKGSARRVTLDWMSLTRMDIS